MLRITSYARRVQFALFALLFTCALAACGGGRTDEAAYPDSSQSAAQEESAPSFASPVTPRDADGAGIDQTTIDVCALLPRAEVEAAIGALEEEPTKSLAIGSEVGNTPQFRQLLDLALAQVR